MGRYEVIDDKDVSFGQARQADELGAEAVVPDFVLVRKETVGVIDPKLGNYNA